MNFLCCDCGKKFTGPVNNEKRTCPACNAPGSEHIAEIATSVAPEDQE